MKRSLTSRSLLLAALNLALLGVACALFIAWQLRQDFESFLLAGAGGRMLTASREIADELLATPLEGRQAVLARHSERAGVELMLVLNDGTHVAGPHLTMPPEVVERLRESGPPGPQNGPRPGGRRGGPRRGGPPPEGRRGGGPPSASPLFLVRTTSELAYWVGVRTPVPGPDGGFPRPGTLLVASESFIGNPFLFQPLPWVALFGLALATSVACWLPWALGVTRAVQGMEGATARIAEGRFDVRLDVSREDELGRLAGSINEMAHRLAQLVQAQKRFLSDAAHELRSPLTRMQVAVDLLGHERSEARARYLNDVREDIEEMRRITEALLEIARHDMQSRSGMETVSVSEIVERAVRVEARDADVRVTLPAAASVRGNREQLSRAVANVVRNAVRYAGAAGPIAVAATVEAGMVRISVADQGPGVPDAELPHLFTPFHRLDGSRDRRSGGTGLGLAIVQAAVDASGGSVTCRNITPTGLEVCLTLPLDRGAGPEASQ